MAEHPFKFRRFGDVFDLTAFSWPVSGSVAGSRVNRNLYYYQANYCIVLVSCLMLAAVLKPTFGAAIIAFVAGGYYLFVVLPTPEIHVGAIHLGEEFTILIFIALVVLVLVSDCNPYIPCAPPGTYRCPNVRLFSLQHWGSVLASCCFARP